MRHIFTQSLAVISQAIPFSLYPLLVRRDVISIFYHAVSNGMPPHIRHLYPVVPAASFEAALDDLQDKNYTFISYDQLQAHAREGKALPPRAIHLSFDDGFTECFSTVRPILLERGLPCTFFLTIDWLDNRMLYFRHQISLCVHYASEMGEADQAVFLERLNRQFNLALTDIARFSAWILAFRQPNMAELEWVCDELEIDVGVYLAEKQPYLTTAQVLQLQSDGFTIGAHGLSHRKLGLIPTAAIEPEIVGSCRAIQAITGRKVVPFSFPQSAGNISRDLLADILGCNPEVGLLFDTKDLRVDADIIINRVWAERPLTPDRTLHPLTEILKHAYQDAWVEGVIRVLSGR